VTKASRRQNHIDTESLIESSYCRLLSAIEQERERLRGEWQSLKNDRQSFLREASLAREETEVWCAAERAKIDAEHENLRKRKEKVALLVAAQTGTLPLLVSGERMDISANILSTQPESYLAHMFMPESIKKIPKKDGCYVLDFHPKCFRIIVNYMQALYLTRQAKRAEPALPIIPHDIRIPMTVFSFFFSLI